jgi:carbon storage regulator
MLVLTRRVGEKIVIADHIEVMVVAIIGNKVRLGIEAPKGVPVDREEVHGRRTVAAGPQTTWGAAT